MRLNAISVIIFDHNIHYAMDTVEVDDENMIGKIMKVYVKGYKLHDRLIRPATVSVGAKKEEKRSRKRFCSSIRRNLLWQIIIVLLLVSI